MISFSSQIIATAAFTAMTGLYLIGGVQLNRYALNETNAALLLSIGSYAAANLLLTGFLKSGQHSAVMAASAVAVLIGHTLAGTMLFDEAMGLRKLLGLGCALVALWLLNLPTRA